MTCENRSTFLHDDVTLLLTDITGKIKPKPADERERHIQRGVHYSEMLPLEYKPSERYLAEYYRALEDFSGETAEAVASVSEKVKSLKGENAVLVSLARAGTPAGILIKRYFRRRYGINPPHYTISIVRGRGIDATALKHILQRHDAGDIQFVDGWTGKGAIAGELAKETNRIPGLEKNGRLILAVLADPAGVTDVCGTHEDIPIASAFLNSTVCGLMSRTVIRPGIEKGEFHGVAFYDELASEDRTYEFIERIESRIPKTVQADLRGCIPKTVQADLPGCIPKTSQADPKRCTRGIKDRFSEGGKEDDISGIFEITKIARRFDIRDINFIKPGIGEATRVLLRRIPDMVLIAENAKPEHVAHIVTLAEEKNVPIVRYPLVRYKACGIIKDLQAEL